MIDVLLIGVSFYTVSLSAVSYKYDYAMSYASQGDCAGALDMLKPILVQDPYDPSVLYDAGVLSWHSGDRVHALDYFNKAGMYAGDNTILQEKALVNEGTVCACNNDFENAVLCLQKALVINPDNSLSQKKLAEFQKKLDEQRMQDQGKDDTGQLEQKNPDVHGEQDKEDKQSSAESFCQNNHQADQKKPEGDTDSEKSNTDSGAGSDEESTAPEDANPDSGDQKNASHQQGSDLDNSSEQDALDAADEKYADENDTPDTDKKQKTQTENALPEQGAAVDPSDADLQRMHENNYSTKDRVSDDFDEDELSKYPVHQALEKQENEWMNDVLDHYDKHDVKVNKALLRSRVNNGSKVNLHEKNW